ncbi:ERAD-associated protein [Coemansia sp. RSA 2611]|nr:ERAD-associated protein [Coemansia sp. RSA 2704]KAJ2366425.1 ERAD-associated protein [Coemansia sp. RSA 2610]KAJ2389283.1 ERAD-associated protein [Coemansia sp. RSA 2611]
MRCGWGVLLWALAAGAVALDTTDHTAEAAQPADATVDVHAQESLALALEVLEQYEQAEGRAPGRQRRYESQLKTYRDISWMIPGIARPYAQRAARLFMRAAGLTDHVGEQYAGGRAEQPAAVRRAIGTLRELAAGGHEAAQFAVADMETYGKYGSAIELGSALQRFQRLADGSGNATAQYMVGFFYAAGLGGVDAHNGHALLYTTLAAIQGHTAAEATLAFRHLAGVGVPVSCERALGYYQAVARKAVAHYRAGPVMGRHMPDYRVRLADDHGGAYGVRTGPYSLHKLVDQRSFDELLQYHQQNALKGELKACMTLVDLYYHGHRYAPRNFAVALKYLRQVRAQLFAGPGEVRAGLAPAEAALAAQAAAMLGVMSLRGEGMAADPAAAQAWLNAGAKLGSGMAFNALGVMHQQGISMPANRERAIEMFKLAAERRHHGGQVNFALAIADVLPDVAHENLKRAAEGGHILAHFHLAELYAPTQCGMAVASYKYVAEFGDWLHSPIPRAAAAYRRGALDAAALGYMQAAEMGYGVGQLNAALLLETAGARLSGNSSAEYRLFGTRAAHERQTLAYWTRAANQNMPDARAKQGDHYYYGRGVARDAERAAAAYTVAAEADANALAMWNLGYMYENGDGVRRDFYLAKRWYDKSIEANEAGRLAGHLALARLCAKYMWAWLIGDDVGESPLFFAPRPVTREEEEAAAARNDAQAPDDWEHAAAADTGEDSQDDETAEEVDESLSGNIFFIMLFLAAAWMFLPFR